MINFRIELVKLMYIKSKFDYRAKQNVRIGEKDVIL